jgi:hypothetical protein
MPSDITFAIVITHGSSGIFGHVLIYFAINILVYLLNVQYRKEEEKS